MKKNKSLSLAIIVLFFDIFCSGPLQVYGHQNENGNDSDELKVNYELRTADSNLPICGEDEIIIKFHGEVSEDDRYNVIQQHNCVVKDICTPADLYLLRIPDDRTPLDVIEIISGDKIIGMKINRDNQNLMSTVDFIRA